MGRLDRSMRHHLQFTPCFRWRIITFIASCAARVCKFPFTYVHEAGSKLEASYIPPLSVQTTLAPSPNSTNSPKPLTRTASSLSNARLRRSQLRLLSRRAARQCSSKSKHSRPSSILSALTNRWRRKFEVRVKFARESRRMLLVLYFEVRPWSEMRGRLTACPKRLHFLRAQSVEEV